MTNTTIEEISNILRPGMHVQLENGSVHQIIDVRIRRTPKRRLLREFSIRSELSATRIDLLSCSWRIVTSAKNIIRGSHNCVDGLHHSQSCSTIRTFCFQTRDGWQKTCVRCGFGVIRAESQEIVEALYVADQIGKFC